MDAQWIDQITELVMKELQKQDIQKQRAVPVGVSARHVHLSKEHVEHLFGAGYTLTKRKDLSMKGEFACEETVTLLGDNLTAIERVRILGPVRSKTQVEISRTDAHKLGLRPPVRSSGDLRDSSPIAIVGPKGALRIQEGCIIANRHVHMSPKDAEHFGVGDGQLVSIQVHGELEGVLSNVQVRVKDTYVLEVHLDTDAANGMGVKNGDTVELIE